MAWTDMTQLTGLVAWYKPETLAASHVNGDPISTWADSSGNSRDLTGTTTTRPLAAASAINGYMAADFDGTNDILSSASYTLASGHLTTTIVVSVDVLKNFNSLFCIDNTDPPFYVATYLHAYIFSDAQFRIGFNAGAGNQLFDTSGGTGPVTTGNWFVISYSASDNASYVRINGNQWYFTGSLPNQSGGTAYNFLGFSGSGYLNGKVSEVVCHQPTTSDHSAIHWVEGYLADKYAITLPDGHLFKNEAPQSAPTTYNTTGTGATNVAAAKFTRLE